MKRDWQQIEKDFIEWDNESHSNASQRQILDWFKDRFNSLSQPPQAELIAKMERLVTNFKILSHTKDIGLKNTCEIKILELESEIEQLKKEIR